MENKEQRINEMKQKSLIDKVYDLGFEAGYEQRLDDAWEAARKIVASVSDGGLSSGELVSIFGSCSFVEISHNNTASEAIAKIKAYEEHKKAEEEEIKVGDEVVLVHNVSNDCIGVVVEVMLIDGKFQILWRDGYTSAWDKEEIKKTGRHFPQIAAVLKMLQEGE